MAKKVSAKLMRLPEVAPTTRQVAIVHLSDLHFGPEHRFDAVRATGEGKLPNTGRARLIDALQRDLSRVPNRNCPTIVCITGDLTEGASSDEFRQAESFIKQLANQRLAGSSLGLKNIFIVPGNHDLAYGAKESEDRWTPWASFCSNTFGSTYAPRDRASRISFHDRVDDLGAIIVCLNSAEYVEKGTDQEKRGFVDEEQLGQLKRFLESVEPHRLESSIRIALIHHHPVLIPGLAEAGRGYDAVENSGLLLTILRNFGFQLVLHGHKHTPYHFSENSITAFHEAAANRPPILIVAGGSASSKELPEGGFNCFNKIVVKWNPEAAQGRIMLWTSELLISKNGERLLSSEWKWKTRLVDDRPYLGGPSSPQSFKATSRDFESAQGKSDEAQRSKHYNALRFNLPVCEVMPSLISRQHNEVRLWIEFHYSPRNEKIDRPVEVIWSAGEMHKVVSVLGKDDARYCATLHYYGPMLVQAKFLFEDGHVAYGYVYARMPTTYRRPDNPPIDLG